MTSPSYTIDDLGTSLRFCFRSREGDSATIIFVIGNVSYIAFLSLCAVMLFLAKPPISQGVINLPTDPFFLGAWILFLFIFLILIPTWVEIIWRLNGKEIVEINVDGVSIRHQNLSFKITESFNAKRISCIFISRHKESESVIAFLISLRTRRFSSFNRGKIAFNYGKAYNGEVNTLRFAPTLDPDEARQVVAAIHKKFPQYKCPPKNVA
jgi:hypothetical protein